MRIDTLDMRQNILTEKRPKRSDFTFYLSAFTFLLLAFPGCKKTDSFYEKLQALPQVDNTATYAYKPAYIVGDTMVVTGKLYPESNLQITIAGKAATIVKTDSVKDNNSTWLNRAYLLISANMVGKANEVKITSGGYSILGATIDVYTPGGPGSFDKDLKSVVIKSFTNGGENIFLHCQNGKGDVYYYSEANKDLRYIKKDGTETVIYDLSGALNPGGVPITQFIAGGVDPQGLSLYFSAQTSPTDYVFGKIDLTNAKVSVLNRSQDIAAPYEGAVSTVKMIVSGIYPDSKGNVYLTIGAHQGTLIVPPDALAKYNSTNGNISYVYKKLFYQNTFPGMPGIDISFSNRPISFRFSPDEKLMYITEQAIGGSVIEVYDMEARIKLQSLTTKPSGGLSLNVISPFSSLKIGLGTGESPDQSFGFLPMPGKRLQVLLLQYLGGQGGTNIAQQYGFPKWIVFDFAAQRTYAYATGRFDQNGYILQPTSNLFPRSAVTDELLNYDEDGNLYATASGKAVLIKTQPVN